MYDLIRRARLGEDNPSIRRRLEAGPQERDFPVLNEFFAAGATDYLAQIFTFGKTGEPAHGTGIVCPLRPTGAAASMTTIPG